MADQQEDQQQQQNILDAELVPVDDQVRIGTSNYMIALEKSQHDVIYKVCLAILKQYSFFNAFIRTANAPEIYMQQFWHTITYDLTAKTYFFKIDYQIFKVNEDLLHEALQITLKDSDHPFIKPPSEKEILSFINKLGYSESLTRISYMAINNLYQPWRTFMTMINKCLTRKAFGFDRPRLALLQVLWGMVTRSNVDYAELIWEDFKFHIGNRKINPKNKELLPFPRFTKLIITHILSHNDHISKRPLSYHHIIKLDTPLGNLNDEIKNSDDYLNYLDKSSGTKPVKSRGKGLLTKQGVEVAVERVSIPRKIRSKTVNEETGQSEEVADAVDSEETKEEEEPKLTRRRKTGVIIERQANRESEEENLDHSSKLKGIKILYAAAQFKLDMKKARKANKDDIITQQRPKGSGSGVTPAVPDEPSSSSSSSSSESEDEIEDISSDEERSEADDTEKADAETTEIADADKVNDDKVDEEKVDEEQFMDKQDGEEQPMDEQAETDQPKKTLSSAEYSNQFTIDNPDVSINDVLKEPVEVEVQSMVEVPVLQEKPAD
ncbi:hypothetical protein Tco_0818978 [Tanacetum coccineum]